MRSLFRPRSAAHAVDIRETAHQYALICIRAHQYTSLPARPRTRMHSISFQQGPPTTGSEASIRRPELRCGSSANSARARAVRPAGLEAHTGRAIPGPSKPPVPGPVTQSRRFTGRAARRFSRARGSWGRAVGDTGPRPRGRRRRPIRVGGSAGSWRIAAFRRLRPRLGAQRRPSPSAASRSAEPAIPSAPWGLLVSGSLRGMVGAIPAAENRRFGLREPSRRAVGAEGAARGGPALWRVSELVRGSVRDLSGLVEILCAR